jgi:hypothetical protein
MMKLYAFDIPNEPAMLPAWLESQLMAPHLVQLVTELNVLRGAPAESRWSLGEVLGAQRAKVLQGGLGTLPHVRLRELVRQPDLLLELQRLILDEGGDYWMTLPAQEEIERTTWKQVRAAMQDLPTVAPPARSRSAWRFALTSLVTAAALLVAVFAYERWHAPSDTKRATSTTTQAPAFAWSTPHVWPQADRAEYLSYFGAQAEAFWFADPPKTTAALAQRLGELRKGCSVLIAHEHTGLGKEDLAWLKAKCQAWAQKLDAQQQRLEGQGDTGAADVQAKVDEIVHNLARALRERANA